MRKGMFFAALVVGLSVAGSAFAQDAAPAAGGDNAIADGAKSLSFGIPGGGNAYADGTAGLWMVMGGTMNIGFNVGLAYDSVEVAGEGVTSWDLLLAPALRMYQSTNGNVLPFWFGQANVHLYSDGNDATDDDLEFGVAGGMGLEWFVTKNFSVAGQVGLGMDILRKVPDANKPVKLGTFTSALTAQIYGG